MPKAVFGSTSGLSVPRPNFVSAR